MLEESENTARSQSRLCPQPQDAPRDALNTLSVGWIRLAQDRDPWWLLMNTVMDIRVP
ncbi:hypothetical protein L798_02543 [Zootermopsis nevadensis]|uniref:Uncharacterized protein n=1 Tax=Zootermopsis nevadensis TaxID=136037 RepID=A0A067RQN4_ZOONE|nr:hypothetical protein L798_02543 [Zootermopsis nevadensis]